MRRIHPLGIPLCAVAFLAGCGSTEPRLLPATPTSAAIPTGDPAGPAERGAELVENPFAHDPDALRDGERLYREMNCAYCHRFSGAGAMGPSLIDGEWLFGDTPADRFTSIHGGRSRGMPSFGRLLPDEAIWKLVAYVESLPEQPPSEPGRLPGPVRPQTR